MAESNVVEVDCREKNSSRHSRPPKSGNRRAPHHHQQQEGYDRTHSTSMDDPNIGERDSPGVFVVEEKMLREQDRFLPIANISRIMKRFIPESGKIAKDAKECVQECVSEFISFVTSEASERCHNEKRKTINGEDILWAMQTLGFEPYVEPLKLYLSKYRSACKGDKALQEMGLAPDDQEMADCGTPNVSHSDLSGILSGNQILLNSDNISLVTADGDRSQGQNVSGNQQVAFLTAAGGGNQQIMYLENFPTGAAFQTNQGGQAQFITINRPQGLQFLQLVPASSLSGANGQQLVTGHGQQILTVQSSQSE